MSSDIFNRLLAEADLSQDGDHEFDHAVIRTNFPNLVATLSRTKGLATQQVLNGITGRVEWIEERKLFMSPVHPESLLVWSPVGDTELVETLSHGSDSPVGWIYVDQPTRSWAYLEYLRGVKQYEILDPRNAWRTGLVDAEILRGKGHRDFATMASFLSAIRERYQPLDMFWSFATWNNPELRDEYLASEDVSCTWSLEMVFAAAGPKITPHGQVPTEYTRLAKTYSAV